MKSVFCPRCGRLMSMCFPNHACVGRTLRLEVGDRVRIQIPGSNPPVTELGVVVVPIERDLVTGDWLVGVLFADETSPHSTWINRRWVEKVT